MAQKRSWRKSSLTRENYPGYPRCNATRMASNDAEEAEYSHPIWKCWRRFVLTVDQLDT